MASLPPANSRGFVHEAAPKAPKSSQRLSSPAPGRVFLSQTIESVHCCAQPGQPLIGSCCHRHRSSKRTNTVKKFNNKPAGAPKHSSSDSLELPLITKTTHNKPVLICDNLHCDLNVMKTKKIKNNTQNILQLLGFEHNKCLEALDDLATSCHKG